MLDPLPGMEMLEPAASPPRRPQRPEPRPDATLPQVLGVDVEVVRSSRRRRTVTAYRSGPRIVVQVPARLSRREEAEWVERMVRRVLAGERRAQRGDDELLPRAQSLSDRYLGGRARARSVRWVDNQESRWGSCTPADGSIRLSRRLVGMPDYVVDYVLLHELAHLLVPGHGPQFWGELAAYPRLERARGYLEGVATAARLPGLCDEPAA